MQGLVHTEHSYLHMAKIELLVRFVASRQSDIIFVLNFMQAVYSRVPETNPVSKVHSVAADLCAPCNATSHVKCVLYLYIVGRVAQSV